MSLDFDLSAIDNYREVCWTYGQDDLAQLNSETEKIVWATMMIGLNTITEDNLDEWIFRLFIVDRVLSGYRQISRECLTKHIGLWTNVSVNTRAKFLKKMNQLLVSYANDAVHRATQNC